MMKDTDKVKIKNRTNGIVIYVIPDMSNLRREFAAREEKIITFEELRKLSYIPGGKKLIEDALVIKDKDAFDELGLEVEPEYFYEKEDVERLLRDGSVDEFLDCLDFAPEGVLDLVKQCAVTMPLNDVEKREIIKDKLNFDVTKVIEIEKASREEDGEDEEKAKKGKRRAAAPSQKQSGSNPERTRRVQQ